MRIIATLIALTAASPALAASGPFFSLGNSNFVVLIAFLLFQRQFVQSFMYAGIK